MFDMIENAQLIIWEFIYDIFLVSGKDMNKEKKLIYN